MKRHKCYDHTTRASYPDHEWAERGQCTRCGAWMPGITRGAREEMEEQAERASRRTKERLDD